MISKRSALIILVLALALAASVPARAQFQGKITGRVLDPAGNPVEKAEVSIVSQKTSSVRYELKTDKEGRFLQIGLMPGYYLVTVKKSGFVSGSKETHVGVAAEEVFEIKSGVIYPFTNSIMFIDFNF